MGSKIIFAGVACICSLTLAAGAAEREPLEKFQGQPAAKVWRREYSPATISQFGPFTSYQVNVNASGQNIIGDAANETSLCLDPLNPNRMAIGWRQFDHVSSSFRVAGYAYTVNGGTSWTFPGALESTVFGSDPVLASDSLGDFFYLRLVPNFYDDMWNSMNGGQSWLRLGPAYGGDKQWFTIDNTNSPGHGFQYQVWSSLGNNFDGRTFSRSTDGGANWSDPIYIPNSPSWATLDVDSNGNLFIGGVDFETDQLWCVRSTDAKNAAVTPSFDQSTAVDLGGVMEVNVNINPVGLLGQMNLAVDKSGSATNNNVYMLASVRSYFASDGGDVMFVRSTDGGQTFSAPRRINDDPVNDSKWHWMAAMSVAPNGRIDVVWLDTRAAANNTDSQLYYAYSFDGGANWSPNIAVSNAFNPFIGYPQQSKMGDYMSIVSNNAGGNVAYCATFNGGQDIYYVRVAPQLPAVVGAVSRKTHAGAGTFDISLPLSGPAGVECRNNSGNHQLVITFANNVTVGDVTVSSADSSATATETSAANVVTVNLSNVADAQTLSVKLRNVNDGVGFGDVVIPMAVLLGDANGDRAVNSADATIARNRSGQLADTTNFRTDVNVDGVINSADATIVRNRSGQSVGATNFGIDERQRLHQQR
ncbi:MAG: dockerin type I domain-containing protein [Chthoniobacterales bacterium]